MNQGRKEKEKKKKETTEFRVPASTSKEHNPNVSEPQGVRTKMQGLVKRNKSNKRAELQLKRRKKRKGNKKQHPIMKELHYYQRETL